MSIIFQQLVRKDGILRVTTDAVPPQPAGSQGLLINADGEVYAAFTPVVIDRYYYGLPYTADGALVLSANAINYFDQSIPFAADGGIAVGVGSAPDYYNQGIAYLNGGAIVADAGVVPMNPPDQVTNLVVTIPNLDSLTLTWDTPASPDAPINGYTVEYKLASSGTWITINLGVTNTTQINGLTAGETYDTRVAANNIFGVGPFSTIVQGVPEEVPDAPANLVLTSGVNEINAAWDAVTSFPAVTSYTMEYKESSSGTWIPTNTGLSLTIDILSLKSGVAYDVRVYATNSRGDGPPTAIEVATPTGVPETIADLAALAGIEQADLSWTAPTASPALTGYNIELKLTADSQWFEFVDSGLDDDITIFALSAAQYDFRVRGINALGVGAWSTIEQATPTAIAATLVGLFNEFGVDQSSPVTFNLNQGSAGADWDASDVLGDGSSITAQVRKDKPCWQIGGNDAGLSGNSVSTSLSQPYSIASCQLIFFSQGAPSRILVRAVQAEQTYRDAGYGIWSGVNLDVATPLQTGTESIVISNHNGGSSSIRALERNGSVDVSVAGNAGNDPFLFQALGWLDAGSADRSANAQIYENRIYDGALSGPEIDAIVGAFQQKWWPTFPYIANAGPPPPPTPLMVWDETGVQSVGGQGTEITGWINTGSSAGSNDFDTPVGTTSNLQQNSRNSLPMIQANSGALLSCSNPSAPLAGPYTIYVAGVQFTQNASVKYWFNGAFNNVNFRVSNADHQWWCGTALIDPTNGGFSSTVFALVCDGVSSRMVAQGGVTFDLTGDAGSNAFQPESVFWNTGQTGGTDFSGQFYEFRVYDSAHDTTEINSTISALRTKWGF